MSRTIVAIVSTVLLVEGVCAVAEDAPAPLIQAHAHNDYLHPRPLLDALALGFCSVEADVFLREGKLLVAHTRGELSAQNTLENLYLKPLQARVRENGGRVYRDGPVFTLLIDIKADGAATYRRLDELLTQYRDIFSYVEDGKLHGNAIAAIVSGDRPVDVIGADSLRFVAIDGRLSDLPSDRPVHWMPLISDNWRNHFRWRGDGAIPSEELQKLSSIVKKTHDEGRRLRFWAIPDEPAAWRTLHAAGVDLIGTDDLQGLSDFLRREKANRDRKAVGI